MLIFSPFNPFCAPQRLRGGSGLAVDKYPNDKRGESSSPNRADIVLPAAAKNRKILHPGIRRRIDSRSKVIPLLDDMPSMVCQGPSSQGHKRAESRYRVESGAGDRNTPPAQM